MKKTAKTAVKTAKTARKVNKSNNKQKSIVKTELDNNYVFAARDSKVNNHLLTINSDYDSNFFSLYASTNYLQNNACLNYAHYSKKQNKCLICAISDFCKSAKYDSQKNITSVQIEEKTKRTSNATSMLDTIILAMYNDSSTQARQALAVKLAAQYNKKLSAVMSQITSYACVVKNFKNNVSATHETKKVQKYCAYLLGNYKVDKLVMETSITSYCVRAYNLLKSNNLI